MDSSEIKIINPKGLNSIRNLKKSEIAFPNIQFKGGKLNRKRTTIKGAFTNISKNVNHIYISQLVDIWDKKGNIKWQNSMLEKLEKEIVKMIEEFELNQDSFLLKKIFIYIQLWGGNTSRGFFLQKNGGFKNNFIEKTYTEAIKKIQQNKPIEGLEILIKLNQMGISFATKHIYFWSKLQYPIYDNIIAMLIFGRFPKNDGSHYKEYVDSLNCISIEQKKESSLIERSLFNWFESRDGKIWFCIRKTLLNK